MYLIAMYSNVVYHIPKTYTQYNIGKYISNAVIQHAMYNGTWPICTPVLQYMDGAHLAHSVHNDVVAPGKSKYPRVEQK